MAKPRQVSSGGDFQPLEQGVHAAVCTMVVDVGLQKAFVPGYGDKFQIVLGFEVPGERRTDGKPEFISTTQTNALSKKANLRKMIESWFGKSFPSDEVANDFDNKALLGKACLLNVTHKVKGDKVYANISTITPLIKGIDKPVAEGELLYYSEAGDQELAERSAVYAKLPTWLQKRIDSQLRAEAAAPEAQAAVAAGDDIPF